MLPRLTPKQKRKFKQQAKQEANEQKKARLLARPAFQKLPRTLFDTDAICTPRTNVNPDSIMQRLVEWSSNSADIEGNWSWGQNRQWSEDDWNNVIYPNLHEFQKVTWAEILKQATGTKKKRHKKHHDMNVCILAPEACKRWDEIGLGQFETAFRFRVGGRRRLWGYRVSAKFFLIWWDKLHKIYPVD